MIYASRMPGAFAAALAACLTALPIHAAAIDPDVAQDLARGGRMNVFLKVASDADLSAAKAMPDKGARRQFVHDTLNAHASASQAALRGWLDTHGVRYLSFWINNSLYLYDVDATLVRELATRSDVERVRGDHPLAIDAAVSQTAATSAPATIEWNIEQIHADEVWLHGNMGEGIVIANIDTGVRYTHEALRRQYRGNNGDGTFTHDYNWWDPQHNLAAPADSVGHGTHLMGIAVGGDGPGPQANDIGVAPGARWIAAKGCAQLSCSQLSLISAAQWVTCPTRVDGSDPDCTKAPDIVDNGWGGGGDDPWFHSYVSAWRAAGIIAVFSVGAGGPSCRSIGSPADYPEVVGVGATDMNDVLESFSSRGPGAFRPLKPDIVAPGESIRSASNTGDTAYVIFSGTSMAASHVSGTLALVLAAKPSATYAEAYRALAVGAERNLGPPPGAQSCAGRPYNQYPSFIYGWGRVDADGAAMAITR